MKIILIANINIYQILFINKTEIIELLDGVHPIDLMFLIDGSINAGQDNFYKELTFVRKLCNRLLHDYSKLDTFLLGQ